MRAHLRLLTALVVNRRKRPARRARSGDRRLAADALWVQADSGHALQAEIDSDLEMTTEVRFEPIHQYDQAGLLVRFSPSCWLKTSVEYEPDGPSRLGVVVTNRGYSDSSTQDVSRDRRRSCGLLTSIVSQARSRIGTYTHAARMAMAKCNVLVH